MRTLSAGGTQTRLAVYLYSKLCPCRCRRRWRRRPQGPSSRLDSAQDGLHTWRQLDHCLLALQRLQSHLGVEGRAVFPASLRHFLLLPDSDICPQFRSRTLTTLPDRNSGSTSVVCKDDLVRSFLPAFLTYFQIEKARCLQDLALEVWKRNRSTHPIECPYSTATWFQRPQWSLPVERCTGSR